MGVKNIAREENQYGKISRKYEKRSMIQYFKYMISLHDKCVRANELIPAFMVIVATKERLRNI